MNILFCGDVCGKSGRDIVKKELCNIQKKYNINFTIINAENASHGLGLTPNHAEELLSLNIDVITLGNHSFDKPEIKKYLLSKDIIHPLNYKKDHYIKGYIIKTIQNDKKVMVVSLLGEVFTVSKISINNPFQEIDNLIEKYQLKKEVDIIIVDFHCETTSEKHAIGFYLDGRVSAVLGTHTHIPTQDSRILPKGTGYQTDVGMCGNYNSIIGMKVDPIIKNCYNNNHKKIISPQNGSGTLCASVLDIDENNGLCKNIIPIIIGANLKNYP